MIIFLQEFVLQIFLWILKAVDGIMELFSSLTGISAINYTFTIGHYYVKGQTVAPTCTTQGYTVYECISCDDYYHSDYVQANGHSYKTTVYPPTCLAQGYTVYVCEVCNYTYTGDYKPAKGHSYVREVVEPTCTERGYTVSTIHTIDTGVYNVVCTDAAGNVWETSFASQKVNVLTQTLQQKYYEAYDKAGDYYAFMNYENAYEFALARENGFVKTGTWHNEDWDTGIASSILRLQRLQA